MEEEGVSSCSQHNKILRKKKHPTVDLTTSIRRNTNCQKPLDKEARK
jgi:hypothetical protein